MKRNIPKLRRLLRKLPQELYDKIYEQTFTAERGVVCNLGSLDHQFSLFASDPLPHLLWVNRASRAQFAESYYANTTFVGYGHLTIVHWLRLVPAEHRKQIIDIRLAHSLGDPESDDTEWARRALWDAASPPILRGIRSVYGDQCVDAMECGYETEVTMDLEGFVMADERMMEGLPARPYHHVEKTPVFCFVVHKCMGVRVRFRRQLNRS